MNTDSITSSNLEEERWHLEPCGNFSPVDTVRCHSEDRLVTQELMSKISE
ncbi:rCG37851, isoform CRA_c [Rattus norvegicus]|uniref:RCG37851, isoform CRA_c n=1 Tax=Rattus norvegicus TaxID=10116 RepID=A6K653_RAT|nr:rCG37851, isoform CRA_c [Rattus norvegicus]